MNSATLLLRQVNPTFIQAGRITSQVFRPTPKDENMLSVDNGDMISAEDAFVRFTSEPNCHSIGVMAVSKEECDQHELPVSEDGEPYPEHCSIDFSGFSKKKVEKIAKFLKTLADRRGWQFQVGSRL